MGIQVPPDIYNLLFEASPDQLERSAQLKGLAEYLDYLHSAGRIEEAEQYLDLTRSALQKQIEEDKRKKRYAHLRVFSGSLGTAAVAIAGKSITAIALAYFHIG